jgi:tRNA A37 threonylcarbamoyladenosine synthetase subunit TsaC/SUA5/YrdC
MTSHLFDQTLACIPPLMIDDADDVADAATVLARGGAVGQAFGNFYALTTRPDARTVRRINQLKGRPPDQVGSVVTTPLRIPLLFDWAALPPGLPAWAVRSVMDALFELGPFGFRGPAAAHVPDHLTQVDAGVRTTQVIAPGYACPSNRFLARALHLVRDDLLFVTSANRSRHSTGAREEPAHWRAEALRAEFAAERDFVVLAHRDEPATRRRYPLHLPMSTTVLAFHKVANRGSSARLIVERHGSLSVEHVRSVAERLGFGIEVAPKATRRLELREYPEMEADADIVRTSRLDPAGRRGPGPPGSRTPASGPCAAGGSG